MKFQCGPTIEEIYAERKRLTNWHRVFRIWPKRIDGACYVFQYVWRKYWNRDIHISGGGDERYRLRILAAAEPDWSVEKPKDTA